MEHQFNAYRSIAIAMERDNIMKLNKKDAYHLINNFIRDCGCDEHIIDAKLIRELLEETKKITIHEFTDGLSILLNKYQFQKYQATIYTLQCDEENNTKLNEILK